MTHCQKCGLSLKKSPGSKCIRCRDKFPWYHNGGRYMYDDTHAPFSNDYEPYDPKVDGFWVVTNE